MMKNNQKGFTLVELTIVILLIGIIAAFIIPAVANKSSSTQTRATDTVRGYVAEYKSNHSTDRVNDVTVIHCQDDTLFVFGCSLDDDVLYVFPRATWLLQAQGNMTSTSFDAVALNIVRSANFGGDGADPYTAAHGLFTCTDYDWENPGKSSLNGEYSQRTQKKMQHNTLVLDAAIGMDYEITDGGVDLHFVRADGLSGDNVATAVYTTTFKDEDNTVIRTFSTSDDDTFTCPADPTKSGKQFLYWELIYVNEDLATPKKALALVPGEEYDVPNSNVIYKAVYDDDEVPSWEGGVYQLYGAKHLKWFVDHVNDTEYNYSGANAILVRSFDAGTLSKSIGTSTRPYHGTFDGNGKTIMNLTVTAGASRTHTALFGYVNGATIKDLTLKNPTITGNTYVSALVAEAVATVNPSYGMTAADTDIYSTAVTKIQNCAVVDAVITCSSVQAADGASAEDVETLAQTSIFKDRYEIQNIDAGEGPVATVVLTQKEKGTYCGGLVGFGENVEITGCTVSGTISGGNNGSAIGGVMGCAQGAHVVIGLESDRAQLGAGCDAVVSGVRYVGGIIGKTQDSDAVTAKLASLATPKTVETGVEIYNSYLTGEVTRYESVMKLPETGYLVETYTNYCIGFGGLVGGTKNSFLTIEDCDTAETAKVDPSVSDEHNYISTYVGGILGYAEEGQILIESTVNKCAVAGRQSTGGIVGAVRDVKISVSECENKGAVVSRVLCAGGIVGYIKTTQTDTRSIPSIQIVNSTNNGTVTSEKRVGGILGEVERIASVTGCTNTAAVSETTTSAQDGGCGGIVGYSVGRLTVENCTNSGAVTSAKQSAGGTIGRMTSYTTVKTSKAPTLHDLNSELPADVTEDVTLSSNGTAITGCSNSGAVTAPKRVGGILGDALRAATLTDCTNTGAITENCADLTALTTDTGCGGIAGYTTAALTITGCTNEGTITSYCQGVGGIVGKATSVTLLKSNSALTVFEKAGLTDADPTAEPPVEEGTLTLTAADTAITNCINKGMVENAPAAAEDIVTIAAPAPGDPEPVYPYRYAGGIAGFADEPITIEVCINASYVAGQTYVGGIAGALVKKDGAMLQSAVRRCISVGIVEARNNPDGTSTAGAVLGTGEWRINYTYNVYLNKMVQKQNVGTLTEIIKNNEDLHDDEVPNYASRYNADSFMNPENALRTLNRDGEGTLAVPAYQLPDNSDPLNPAVFTYSETLTAAVAAYAALEPSVTITLPDFIPEFYVAPAEP